MKRISNNAIIAFILLIPCLVLAPYIIRGTSEEHLWNILDIDTSSGYCDSTSRAMIYSWEWKDEPVRFDFFGKESILFPFEGVTGTNTYCALELVEEESFCSVDYYDRNGQHISTETYALSKSPITFQAYKWIDGKRCRAQKGSLTVTVQEVVEANALYMAMMGAHHRYENGFFKKSTSLYFPSNWVDIYADGTVERTY